MISLAHIPPKASVMYKLSSNQTWQKRYLRFQDCTLQYAHSSTGQSKFECNVEDITGVTKSMHDERFCMSIKIQQKGLEQKILIFSSPNPDDVKLWIQYFDRTLNTLWNTKFNEKKIQAKPLPKVPSNRIFRLPALLGSLDALEGGLPFLQQESHRLSPLRPSDVENLQYSETQDYGTFEVDSNVSDGEDIEILDNEVAYSEHRSSYYHNSKQSSNVFSELSDSVEIVREDKNESIDIRSSHEPDLWKHLNRVGNELNRLNGAFDIPRKSPLANATTTTISTAIIGFAAYLLQINKMSRSLQSTNNLQAFDASTNDYYQFSKRVLVALASPTEDINAEWELEWEINELRSIAKNTADDVIELMQEL